MTRRKLWQEYPELLSRDWILEQIQNHKTNAQIGALVGVSNRTVYKALQYHKIRRPMAISHNTALNEKL